MAKLKGGTRIYGDATVDSDLKVGISTSQGVVLTDQNGVPWRLYVNTNGTLGITSAI